LLAEADATEHRELVIELVYLDDVDVARGENKAPYQFGAAFHHSERLVRSLLAVLNLIE